MNLGQCWDVSSASLHAHESLVRGLSQVSCIPLLNKEQVRKQMPALQPSTILLTGNESHGRRAQCRGAPRQAPVAAAGKVELTRNITILLHTQQLTYLYSFLQTAASQPASLPCAWLVLKACPSMVQSTHPHSPTHPHKNAQTSAPTHAHTHLQCSDLHSAHRKGPSMRSPTPPHPHPHLRTHSDARTWYRQLHTLSPHERRGHVLQLQRVHGVQLLVDALEHVVVQVPGLRHKQA